jgi:hypothetical protein
MKTYIIEETVPAVDVYKYTIKANSYAEALRKITDDEYEDDEFEFMGSHQTDDGDRTYQLLED